VQSRPIDEQREKCGEKNLDDTVMTDCESERFRINFNAICLFQKTEQLRYIVKRNCLSNVIRINVTSYRFPISIWWQNFYYLILFFLNLIQEDVAKFEKMSQNYFEKDSQIFWESFYQNIFYREFSHEVHGSNVIVCRSYVD